MPELTFLQFREIDKLIHNNDETEHEYYGNSIKYKIEFIIVRELENLTEYLKKKI